MSYSGRDEEVPRHLIDGVEHGEIVDPLLVQQLDEPLPRAAKFMLRYGSCHHVSAEASTA